MHASWTTASIYIKTPFRQYLVALHIYLYTDAYIYYGTRCLSVRFLNYVPNVYMYVHTQPSAKSIEGAYVVAHVDPQSSPIGGRLQR